MIIKGKEKRKFRWYDVVLLLIPGLLFLCFSMLSIGEGSAYKQQLMHSIVVCSTDMETVEGDHFVNEGAKFAGGSYRSSDYAHSGMYSVEVNQHNIYALENWHTPKESRRMQVSVWRYSPDGVEGVLVAAAKDSDQFYVASKASISQDDGWDLLTLDLNVPESVSEFKIYCFIVPDGERSVYFDDLEVREVPAVEGYEKVDLPEVLIETSPTGMRKLEAKRANAWEKGILESDRSDWIDARIVYNEQPFAAKMRLKGDWLDHLEGDKWSFRIKLQDGAIDGKQVFSVQSPHTRSFLHEWVFHELLLREDILTPSYGFVKLKLNNKILGVYAMEEHFVKSLAEHRDRREGPILKLTEDDFWHSIKLVKEVQKDDPTFSDASIADRAFQSSKVESFEEDNALDNERLRKQTERAYAMLRQYKYNEVPPSSILDAERMGKYLAIVDLTQAYHGLAWHNQRWYYNPVADLLEPIGYDGYTENLTEGAMLLTQQVYKAGPDYDPYQHLFYDREVMFHYCRFLDQLVSTDYLDLFQAANRAKIKAYKEALHAEYSTIVYDSTRLQQRAKRLQNALPPNARSMGVFTAGEGSYSVVNRHLFPLEITGYRVQGSPLELLDSAIFVTPTTYSNRPQNVSMPPNVQQVTYQLVGGGETFETSVSPIQVIVPERPVASLDVLEEEGFSVVGRDVVARSCTLTKPLLIPQDYRLILLAGTEITLNEGAYVLSRSPVEIVGTADEPVVISSADGTGAFAVIQAERESKVAHAHFRGLGTIDDAGYVLTGGVTFHQSPVTISFSTFEDNHEEDALNVVNTTFTLDHCVFARTAFDALDSDFCQGDIRDCFFSDTGNDALDFSGSTARIDRVTMQGIGDKGISAGEHSQVIADEVIISNAKIGVVAKDLSELTVGFIRLSNVNEGFAAYRKKIDFGPGTLLVERYQVDQVKYLKMIEDGSTIELNTEVQ